MKVRKKGHKKAIIITLGILLIIVGAAMVVSRFLNTSSDGSLSSSYSTGQTQPTFDLTPKPYNGNYMSFNYPVSLKAAANNKLVTPVVAMANFSYPDIASWNLAIDIIQVPSGTLSGNNSYQVRQINPAVYQQSMITIHGKPITVMTDTQATTFSKVAFLIDGQYQATVSLYGNDFNPDYLTKTFMMILSSWVWHI
jgi:hypothetical protein